MDDNTSSRVRFTPKEIAYKRAIHEAVRKGVPAQEMECLSKAGYVASELGISESALQKMWSEESAGRPERASETVKLIKATSQNIAVSSNPILLCMAADLGITVQEIPRLQRYDTAGSILADLKATKQKFDIFLDKFMEHKLDDGKFDDQEVAELKGLLQRLCQDTHKLVYLAENGVYND